MNRTEIKSPLANDIPLRAPLVEKEIPGHMWLRFPIDLLRKVSQTEQCPKSYALGTLKLGILADRGFVYQRFKDLPLTELNVSDFPPYSANIERTTGLIAADYYTLMLLWNGTKLLPSGKDNAVTNRDIQDWYSRAITLRQRFMDSPETRELIILTNGEQYFELSHESLNTIWGASDLPVIRDKLPYDVTLTLLPQPSSRRVDHLE
jgi:hypothetical protein